MVRPMLSREDAIGFVGKKVSNENLKKHMFAVAQIMKRTAKEIGRDGKEWELCGLVHDVDYEETKDNPSKHALRSAEMLEGKVSEDILEAVKAHNHEHTGVKPRTEMDKALVAADAASGLIIATALVMPNRKIKEARPESVFKKFDDSSFAKNVDRDRIMYCEEFDMDRDKFLSMALEALQEIDEELGL